MYHIFVNDKPIVLTTEVAQEKGFKNYLLASVNIGKVIRMQIRGISVISRNTQGVTLIGVEEGERVVGAARLAEKDD